MNSICIGFNLEDVLNVNNWSKEWNFAICTFVWSKILWGVIKMVIFGKKSESSIIGWDGNKKCNEVKYEKVKRWGEVKVNVVGVLKIATLMIIGVLLRGLFWFL